MCSSPRLIAAYHVLHRLSMPRHPPCALLRLISHSIVATALRSSVTTGVDSSHPSEPRGPGHHPSLGCQRAEKQSELEMRECGRLPRLFRAHGKPATTRDLQKGGDPAAGSPTATLLRLRPSH